MMDARQTCSMLCLLLLLLLVHGTLQQTTPKKRNGRKEATNAAIEELKQQIDNIVQELNLLKEKQALQTVCLRGIKVRGKCFLANPARKTFHAASDDCIAQGGSLSTPLTAWENEQLHAYVLQTLGPRDDVWLGINDMVMEDRWVDQSGNGARFLNWETSITQQPDGGRGQNCGLLSAVSKGKWFDESCRAEKASVCEFNIV